MSLENIFTMIKADRYTEDGCEKLNKAREEIEDARRTYKPGEISEKTGLQKQSNGTWAPPKKGGTQGAGEKKTEGKKINYQVTEKGGKYYATGYQFSDGSQLYAGPFGSEKAVHEFMNNTPYKAAPETASGKWQKNEDYLGRERISMKTPQGGKVSIYESDNPKQKNARFRVDTGSHYNEFNTMEEAKAFAEKQYGAESTQGAGLPTANHFEAASKAAVTSKDKANLDSIKSYMDEEKATFKDALYTKAEALARKGANGNPDIENEQSMMKLAEAAGMGDSLKQFLKEEVNRTYEFGDSGSERTVNGSKKSFLTSKEFSDTENHSAQLEARKKAEKQAKRDAKESRVDDFFKKMRSEKHPVASVAAELDRGTFDDEVIDTLGDGNVMEELARSLISPAFEEEGDIPQKTLDTTRKIILQRYKKLESEATDSAPRVLTGDCKIRIRK